MAKVTWLGDKEVPDLKETVRWGIKFEKDKAVEVDNPAYLGKLRVNKNFTVEGYEAKGALPPDQTFRPPSQQSVLGAVPKPGEPVPKPPGEVEVPVEPPEGGEITLPPTRSAESGPTRVPLAPPPKPAPKRP